VLNSGWGTFDAHHDIGAGYVGLISGASLTDVGHEVTCVDKDTRKINRLSGGEMPIAYNVRQRRLSFTYSIKIVPISCPVVWLNGSADRSRPLNETTMILHGKIKHTSTRRRS